MFKTEFDAVEKIWSGARVDIHIDKHQNFGEFILNNLADSDTERVMQIDGDTGESLTKAEVRRRTIRCAQNLQKIGCTAEHRIIIIARNHHDLTPLLFAAFCIGTPVCPLDVAQDGLSEIIQRIAPWMIFCDTDVLQSVENAIADSGQTSANIFSVNGKVNGFDKIDSLMSATGDEDNFVCAKIIDSCSHAAIISCSSGTTGVSKSICLSHALFAYPFANELSRMEFVELSFSSLYWISGALAVIGAAFKCTRIFTAHVFSADKFFELVEKYKVQVFYAPPSYLNACVKSDRYKSANLSSLLMCISMGSFITPSLVHKFTELLPQCMLFSGYGTTESGGGITVVSSAELAQHPNIVGHLIPGVKIKILNQLTGKRCGIDEEGEVCVRIPIPSMGYFRDDESNRSSFDADGYFKTGDIGRFDETGRLYVSGRKKDIFKVRHYPIWPVELEDILQKHQAIRNACVVSVFDDGAVADLTAAVIERDDQHTISEDDVYKLISDKLARYKWLDGGVYFDQLPMTPSGKVMRSKVKEMAQNYFELNRNK